MRSYREPETDTAVAPRMTVDGLYAAKLDIVRRMKELETVDAELSKKFEDVHGYTPYYLTVPGGSGLERSAKNGHERYVDKWCWSYLVDLDAMEETIRAHRAA